MTHIASHRARDENPVWILGHFDPEMTRINRMLREASMRVYYAAVATNRHGDRKTVTPSEAYSATDIITRFGRTVRLPRDVTAVFVECGMSDDGLRAYNIVNYTTVDHHRPGDVGYGKPPSEFLAASSIGQVILRLADMGYGPCAKRVQDAGVAAFELVRSQWMVTFSNGEQIAVPQDFVLAAAADHCLSHAYRGLCPGVDPDELMVWRAETRAAHQGISVNELLMKINHAREALYNAPRIDIAGLAVADFREATVPELNEAAAREGIPFIAGMNMPGGRRKIVLQSAPPEVISQWMTNCGLNGVYGDPERGFAGGYADAPDPHMTPSP
jgi:hypothetical protein